jgi:hypothetical protein
MADTATTTPPIYSTDGLTAFGQQVAGQLLQAGLKSLGLASDPKTAATKSGSDVVASKQAASWNWQKVALIVGGVVAGLVVLKMVLKGR